MDNSPNGNGSNAVACAENFVSGSQISQARLSCNNREIYSDISFASPPIRYKRYSDGKTIAYVRKSNGGFQEVEINNVNVLEFPKEQIEEVEESFQREVIARQTSDPKERARIRFGLV